MEASHWCAKVDTSDATRAALAQEANEIEETKMTRQPGLDGRHRDTNGQIRAKNGNTRVDTLRETYGNSFGKGIRGDAKLETLLERTRSNSLSEYLKKE